MTDPVFLHIYRLRKASTWLCFARLSPNGKLISTKKMEMLQWCILEDEFANSHSGVPILRAALSGLTT